MHTARCCATDKKGPIFDHAREGLKEEAIELKQATCARFVQKESSDMFSDLNELFGACAPITRANPQRE